MPFEMTTTRHFSAAHQLRMPDGSLEPLHGHNWQVEVTVSAPALDMGGLVMDFHELERLVDTIVVPMDNAHLNDLAEFASANPSAEHVAWHIGRSLADALPRGVTLSAVKVWETPGNAAAYRP
jgi:6-pyruvoyltetrahydropterin/6-carboxytetrahydropterin synthase